MTQPMLDLDNIQGDVVVGLQKDCEVFLFFKIVDPPLLKKSMRLHVVSRITTARLAHRRDLVLRSRKGLYRKIGDARPEHWVYQGWFDRNHRRRASAPGPCI